MTKNLVITLGRKGDDIVKQSGLAVKRSRVSTALLYDASPDRVGADVQVSAVAGSHTVRLPRLDSVLFYDDVEDAHGVEQIDLHLSLPQPPRDVQDAAAMQAYERALHTLISTTIAAINSGGWSRFIEPGNARIQGKASYMPAWQTNPDPTYGFTFEEWKGLATSTLRWMWRADGSLLQMVYQPGRGGGVVLDSLGIKLLSERLYLAAYDPGNGGDAEAGKKQLAMDTPALLRQRQQRESELRAAGFAVMEQWVERPLGEPAPVAR